ncbi:ABC transporter permease [Embleya sp. NBC_00888]|uniref:FtsX-like permease family protein n=1 Tax=Embleya sp. NBC_00888 TaxID=2975960 RepID=UPI0038645479|nr:ABC transporter permease [Embleya sp. NBC_00888]
MSHRISPTAHRGAAFGRARATAMGARFAVTRASWPRTLLMVVGIGLGTSLLLLASALPGMLEARERRGAAIVEIASSRLTAPGENTLVIAYANTEYRDRDVRGRLVRAEGSRPPVPPGLRALPGPGEMAVSPALARLLERHDGALLRERLPYRVVATIGDDGLTGPAELSYYAGSATLAVDDGSRVDGFGTPRGSARLDPLLTLLVVTALVVVLTPVAVFVAVASRFGADARERRLGALRLVGADLSTTGWIAAGEALAAAAGGLTAGLVLFLLGRHVIGSVELWRLSVFPADVQPTPVLAVLVVAAVPLIAVAVTRAGLRRVVIEPLGVVRRAPRPPRRGWRIVPGLTGVVLLLTLMNGGGTRGGGMAPWLAAAGIVLMLVGLTALLPGGVSAVAARGGRGPLPWVLARRRLAADAAGSTRLVGGVTVAVAGAIAVQMLLAGLAGTFTTPTGQNPDRADLFVSTKGDPAGATALAATVGVRSAFTFTATSARVRGAAGGNEIPLVVGTCTALRELAAVGACAPGDVFTVASPYGETRVGPGSVVELTMTGRDGPVAWTVPRSATEVAAAPDPVRQSRYGLFLTPEALGAAGRSAAGRLIAFVRLDPNRHDAADRVRNTAARIDPSASILPVTATTEDRMFANIRRGLLAGATLTLGLVAAGMLVSSLEQMRERRRPLAALAALGTPRRTMALSLMAQAAVPMVLGLALALAGGLGLGSLLLAVFGERPRLDPGFVASVTAAGCAAVVAVTVLSLPALWRLMRPEGLRME